MLIVGVVEVAALVKEVCARRKRNKPMRKPRWYVDLLLILRRENHTDRPSKGWRSHSNVDCNIQSLSRDYPAKFCLGVLELVVQASQRSPNGLRMIVLDEFMMNADLSKTTATVAFKK